MIQQVALKRKGGTSVSESGAGFHSGSYSEDVITASACSLSGLSPPTFVTLGISSDSFELLALIATVGGHSIPDILFLRFREEQKRWTVHGEIDVLTPSGAIFDSHIQRILSPLHFPALMEELVPFLEQLMPGATNDVYYTIRSPWKEQFAHRVNSDRRLIILAIRLICFVFPRERLWEPQ